MRDDDDRELVTLHAPMSIGTFNAVLDALQREWPLSVPIADPQDPSIIHVMAHGASLAPAR